MCGVPYHSCEGYIARLIAKGYKVAICEQMEDPATAKGLVERDIIRVVTPGTVIDAACLEEGKSNYISGVFLDETGVGLCFVDISTGKTLATAFAGPERVRHAVNELGRFSPAEVVMNRPAAEDMALREFLQSRLHCHRELGERRRLCPGGRRRGHCPPIRRRRPGPPAPGYWRRPGGPGRRACLSL